MEKIIPSGEVNEKVTVDEMNKKQDELIKRFGIDFRIVGYYEIEYPIRRLAGKILTILDASINDSKQNKAIKDLVKGEVFETIDSFQRMYWRGKKGQTVDLEEDV